MNMRVQLEKQYVSLVYFSSVLAILTIIFGAIAFFGQPQSGNGQPKGKVKVIEILVLGAAGSTLATLAGILVKFHLQGDSHFLLQQYSDIDPYSEQGINPGTKVDTAPVVNNNNNIEPKVDPHSVNNICSNYITNNNHVIAYIEKESIGKAELIQYSGDFVRPVLAKLLEKNIQVDLLLQHPSKALNELQLDKMKSLRSTAMLDFANQDKLTIKYYTEPTSIKGIKLDNKYILMGWYTYMTKSNQERVPWLYGHNNAAIEVRFTDSSHELVSTYNRVFQALWESSELLADEDLYSEIENRRQSL